VCRFQHPVLKISDISRGNQKKSNNNNELYLHDYNNAALQKRRMAMSALPFRYTVALTGGHRQPYIMEAEWNYREMLN